MTRTDQNILFTALAFQTVLLQGGKGRADDESRNGETKKVRRLAELFESFCTDNLAEAMLPPAIDSDAAETDHIIEKHKQQLKQEDLTRLPESRDALVRLYDRLQQRKMRRLQRDFYAHADDDEIADLALKLLDEEIADDGALT